VASLSGSHSSRSGGRSRASASSSSAISSTGCGGGIARTRQRNKRRQFSATTATASTTAVITTTTTTAAASSRFGVSLSEHPPEHGFVAGTESMGITADSGVALFFLGREGRVLLRYISAGQGVGLSEGCKTLAQRNTKVVKISKTHLGTSNKIER